MSQTDPEVGLCAACRHARPRRTARGSTFWQCAAAERDPRLRKYPPLPVRSCPAFEPGREKGDQKP